MNRRTRIGFKENEVLVHIKHGEQTASGLQGTVQWNALRVLQRHRRIYIGAIVVVHVEQVKILVWRGTSRTTEKSIVSRYVHDIEFLLRVTRGISKSYQAEVPMSRIHIGTLLRISAPRFRFLIARTYEGTSE
jgi:hypothetical protein